MNKLIYFFLLVTCASCSKNVETKSLNTHAGAAYFESFTCALACRDLTDEEIDDADNLAGGAYADGEWTATNKKTDKDE